MDYPKHFIRATANYNTFENHVPAPCFRKTFEVPEGMTGRILPEPGFTFTDGFHVKPLASGTYLLRPLE